MPSDDRHTLGSVSELSTPRYALIPAAGRGTRVEEITGGGAKELLKVEGLPVIDWAIREGLRSGCEEIGVLVRNEKRDLVDHLQDEWKDTITLIRQSSPDGLGDALLAAQRFIGQATFAVLLPDDLVHGPKPAMEQLIACHQETGMSVVGVAGRDESIHPMFSDCGRVGLEPLEANGTQAYRASFENGEERSIIGRYVFPAVAFDILSETKDKQAGELGEGAVLRALAKKDQLAAYSLSGICFTVGVPEGCQFAERMTDSKV